jgi:hypothetical protein
MNRPSLKARDIEALAYIYDPQESLVPEIHGPCGASPGSWAMVLVTAGLLLLAALMMCLLPV